MESVTAAQKVYRMGYWMVVATALSLAVKMVSEVVATMVMKQAALMVG